MSKLLALFLIPLFLPKVAKLELTADQKKKYQAALSAGRKLEDQGKLDEAMTQFNVALSLVAEDGPTLSEMGVVTFRKKDLKAAEDYTRRSIQSTSDNDVKGASLYNLGRILEEKGDKPGAIAAYVASLAARPHHVVRERLATLDKKQAAALDPFAPAAMEGPFASVADWCNLHPNPDPDAAQGDPDHAADYGYTCNAGPDEELSTGSMSPAKLVAPWRTVRPLLVLTRYHGRGEGERMIEMYLAVETSAGWFVSPSLGTAETALRGSTSLTQSPAELQGGTLVVHWSTERGGGNGCCESEGSGDMMAVAGVGPSGKPSMTHAFSVSDKYAEYERTEEGTPGKSISKHDFAFDVAVGKNEVVVKVGHGKSDMDPKELANVIGRHPLAFP